MYGNSNGSACVFDAYAEHLYADVHVHIHLVKVANRIDNKAEARTCMTLLNYEYCLGSDS